MVESKRKKMLKTLAAAIKDGSLATKLSMAFMGVGQLMRRQYVKGVLYCLLQALFTVYLVAFGGKYLGMLFSGDLGSRVSGEVWNEKLQIFEKVRGDNSFLILLYGVMSLVLLGVYASIWYGNIKGSLENDVLLACGKKVATFQEDVLALLNHRFHITLLLAPLSMLLIFTALPLVFMVLIAFTNYDYAHMPPGKLFDWVGLANFRSLFSLGGGVSGFLAVFLRVFAWTMIWAVLSTFSNYFVGVIISLMINKKGIKGKLLFRTMFVLSIAVPQFVTLLLMQKILDSDGILNKILGTNILWLADQRHFSLLPRIVILLVNLWVGVPYTILMSTGILMNIPADYFEAAKIDGASTVKAFWYITLPYMLQITSPYLITQFVTNINNFNVIWLLTGGGPADNLYYGGGTQAQSTDLLVTWLYRLTTDKTPKYNVASMIGIVIFVLCSTFSLFAYNRSSAVKQEGEFQ